MPKNKLEDLRNHLFETIEALRDEDKPMDIDRAKAVAEVAGVILESAKVEIGYIRVTGADVESEFIPSVPKPRQAALPAASPTANWVQCIDCGEKFPAKKALDEHRRRSHRAAVNGSKP